MTERLPIDWTAASDEGGCEARNRWAMQQRSKASDKRGDQPQDCSRRLLRVLIVDDDRDTTNVTVSLVALWGHEARGAYNAAAALAMADVAPPDVVLLDIAMPGMDGCELSRRLRANPRTSHCLLIAITGYSDLRHRRLCEAAGIDVYLLKPANPEILETLMQLEFQRLGGSVEKGRIGQTAFTLEA
jgi:CheY-like chemotaxis protein